MPISIYRFAGLVTLTTANTAYSLFDLIVAVQSLWTAGDVAFLRWRVPASPGFTVYEVPPGSTGITNPGVEILATETSVEYSDMNDINLHDIFVLSATDAAKIEITVRANRQASR